MPLSFRRQSWLSLALFLHLPSLTHAATLTWLGDVSATWGAGTSGSNTNWVSNTLPANGDSLIFNLTQSGVADLSTTNDFASLSLAGTNAITFTNDTGTGTGFTLAGNAITLGGNITSTGTTGTHLHTIQLDLILSGTRTVTAANNTTIVISGTISESAAGSGFIKAGGGQVTLSGVNSFTGALSVNVGTLSVNTIAADGVASAIGKGSTINLGSGVQAGTLLYTGSAASTDRAVVLAATSTGGGALTNNGSGALLFTGSFSNAGTAAKTFTLGGSNTDANEFQAPLVDSTGGALSVVKSGAGAWTLSGTSSFTGALSVNQGTLTITSISAAGAGDTINLGSSTNVAGTLVYTGSGASTSRAINLAATTNGGATINSSGTGALILSGAITNVGTGTKTLTLGGTHTGGNEIQSAIANGSGSGTLALAKSDTGTWILSGANSYSAGTTLNAGTLALNSATAIGSGTLTIVSGTLDNTSASTVTLTTNNAVALNGSLVFGGTNSLNLGTGVVTIGNASRDITLNGGSTLTLGEVQWNSTNAARVLTVNQGTGSGATLVLGGFQLNINTDTGAKNRTINGTGNVTISGAIANGNAFANGVIYSGTGTLTLSGTSSFTGALSVSQGTVSLASLGAAGASSAAGAGDTINIGGGGNLAGTLVYSGSGASTNRAINLAATSAGGATISSSGSGALIFTGAITNAGTGTKTFTLAGTNTAGNEIQTAITNGSGTLVLAKSDTGTWILSGTNTYSGGTTLGGGTLSLNSTSAIGTGTLTISGTGGTLDNTSASAVTLTTNNAVALNGSLVFGGTNSLNLGTGVVTILNSRDITLNGSSTLTMGELQFNSTANNRTLTVNQGSGSGGTLVLGGFQLNINGADTSARNRVITGTGSVTISGAVVNGNTNANGLVYSGSGTLMLAAASTYTGSTTVNGGTLKLTGSGGISTSSSLTINAGTLDVGGTAATVAGSLILGDDATTVAGKTASIVSSTGGGGFTLGGNVTYNSGSVGFENGQATISASLILVADRTITVNDSANAAVDVLVSGVISGGFALTKGSSGTLRLSGTNTYTGQTLLNNGVTEIYALGNIGVAGSFGTADKDAPGGASTIIRFGNGASTGTLSYLGTGDLTDRRVQIGSNTGATATGGATILSNGSGALVFTATTFNSTVNVSVNGPATARVLTLGGSSTSGSTIQGAIVNNFGAGTSGTSAVALVKQDVGVWILNGTNTYSGGTTVNGGTLVVNNATGSATGTGSVSIASGGHLGGFGTAGSLTAGATFTQQSGAVIFAGQNGALDAQALTLQAAAGFTLSGGIELDIVGGGASGMLNAQSGSNDLLIFSGGAVTLSGATLSIHTALPLNSSTWAAGSSWKLINWTSVSGSFDSITDAPDLSSLGLVWDWSQLYSSGTVSLVVAAPEPSRSVLLMAGLAMALLRRKHSCKLSPV